MKVGQKIWKIRINKPFDNSNLTLSSYKEGIFVDEHKILGISQYKICLNDEWFTTLDTVRERRDRFMYNYIDDINVSIVINDRFFDKGVFISMHSTKKPTKKLYEKMVAKASVKIKKEFNFLTSVPNDLYDLIDEKY